MFLAFEEILAVYKINVFAVSDQLIPQTSTAAFNACQNFSTKHQQFITAVNSVIDQYKINY